MAEHAEGDSGVTLLPRIEDYDGRRQAYVKHFFLAAYLEALAHKVAASFPEVVYVDGFSGPWQSQGENYSDTSFGIALAALRAAKASWKRLKGRDVRMTALLVERNPEAHAELEALQAKYPDVRIKTFKADFRAIVPELLASIPSEAFAFILLDPKGWRIPMEAVAPLLQRPNSEVVFSFMFEFVNRAASMSSPPTVRGLDELLPIGDWRVKLGSFEPGGGEARTAARKRILVDAFRDVLRTFGGYTYVAEVPILRPVRNRLLYSLVYGTRSDTGIEVFRDCHLKTLSEQDSVRTEAIARSSGLDSQREMFEAPGEMGLGIVQRFLRDEKAAAEEELIRRVPADPE